MSFSIQSTCISCSACEAVCPENAITLGDDQYEIEPLHCTECGLCLGHCPVEAIVSPAG